MGVLFNQVVALKTLDDSQTQVTNSFNGDLLDCNMLWIYGLAVIGVVCLNIFQGFLCLSLYVVGGTATANKTAPYAHPHKTTPPLKEEGGMETKESKWAYMSQKGSPKKRT